MRAWFLKIDPVWIIGMRVCMYVCPRPRLLIHVTSGVMWRDIDLIRLIKEVLQLLYGNCSLIVNGVALALICIVETNPIRVS